MKPLLILFVFPLLSTAFHLPVWSWVEGTQSFLSNPIRRSRIPQFIIDTKHPFININHKVLESLENVELLLCSVHETSEVELEQVDSSLQTLGLEIPPDLFDRLEIDNTRLVGTNRPGWPNALERLKEMQRCPKALAQVKDFQINIFNHDSKWAPWYMRILEPSRPSIELLDRFADVLGNMTSIETLSWRIAPKYAHHFEKYFVDRGPEFQVPVQKLVVGALGHFLVSMCPNVTSLENESYYQ
ncbi:hypothetical protein F5Y16DRAFT_373234 [Xylariaceae sp. FL0255]|nr:hypothetical protein F5Y16DRAFT_373234 [Xylariaceae sp. FL0255]